MEEQILTQYENEIARLNGIIGQQQTMSTMDAGNHSIQDPGMVREQIGLEEVFELIDHLLEGETLEKDATGKRVWTKPKDENMKLFSDEGINYIRRRLSWHINKNTLLSNYSEDQIREIVKDFSISLQDAIFMKSKQFFRQPSLEKCKQILLERIKRKVDIRQFTREVLGLPKLSDIVVTQELLKEMEGRIEYELESIKNQLIKNREKEFESAILDFEFLVWSTYNRALGGEERGSIRRHQQSLEVKGGGIVGQEGAGSVKPGLISSMFKK